MYWLSLSFEDGHNDDNVVKHRILKCWCNVFASLKASGLRQMLLIMTIIPPFPSLSPSNVGTCVIAGTLRMEL